MEYKSIYVGRYSQSQLVLSSRWYLKLLISYLISSTSGLYREPLSLFSVFDREDVTTESIYLDSTSLRPLRLNGLPLVFPFNYLYTHFPTRTRQRTTRTTSRHSRQPFLTGTLFPSVLFDVGRSRRLNGEESRLTLSEVSNHRQRSKERRCRVSLNRNPLVTNMIFKTLCNEVECWNMSDSGENSENFWVINIK